VAERGKERTRASCTIHFLDVGQGASAVILYGKRRGIVVDCASAENGFVPSQVVNVFVDDLEHVLITHNHDDHAGGVKQILDNFVFGRAMRPLPPSVWMLHDAGSYRKVLYDYFQDIRRQLGRERIDRGFAQRFVEPNGLTRRQGRQGQLIHPILNASGLRLDCLWPSIRGAGEAYDSNDPNRSSGVAMLSCGNHRVVFGGDATIHAWREIHNNVFGGKTLECEALVLPHHGGLLRKPSHSEDDLRFLFEEVIHPRFAIVSVGSTNSHGHPRREVLRWAKKCGATIACTQITPQCSRRFELVRAGVTEPTKFAASYAGDEDSACAASMTLVLNEASEARWGGISGQVSNAPRVCNWQGPESHQNAIDKRRGQPGWEPCCR
jgi:competence protein ComEC